MPQGDLNDGLGDQIVLIERGCDVIRDRIVSIRESIAPANWADAPSLGRTDVIADHIDLIADRIAS